MARSFPTEICVSLAFDGTSGKITAERALNQAGVVLEEGAKFEIDRKRLCEHNDEYEAKVEMEFGNEVVYWNRTGVAGAKLGIIIYIHY
jgi:hypothetical protein